MKLRHKYITNKELTCRHPSPCSPDPPCGKTQSPPQFPSSSSTQPCQNKHCLISNHMFHMKNIMHCQSITHHFHMKLKNKFENISYEKTNIKILYHQK